MATKLDHKIGDTFIAHGIYKGADGVPINLNTSGITITSAVKARPDGRVFPLQVIIQDQDTNPGMYTLKGQTNEWPLGQLLWDIQYTQADIVFSTQTIQIRTLENVTP